MSERPRRCPECGGTEFTARYATGGGWRVTGYRCVACGHVVERDRGR